MHRTDAARNVGNMFSDGDPGTGTPGTVVDDDWLNAVQEEIVAVIEDTGISLVKGDNDQLLTAIESRFATLKSDENTWSGIQHFGSVVHTHSGAETHSGIEEHTGSETHSGAETHTGAEEFSGSVTFRRATGNSLLVYDNAGTPVLSVYVSDDGKLTLEKQLTVKGNVTLSGGSDQIIGQTTSHDLSVRVVEGRSLVLGAVGGTDYLTINTSTDTLAVAAGTVVSGGATTLIAPTIEAEFSNTTTVKYGKDFGGWVHLMGQVTRVGGIPGDEIFTLPSGCRPSSQRVFEGADYDTVCVNTDGTVVPIPGSGSVAYLDGISFYADGS
jgi:hypothetical protein